MGNQCAISTKEDMVLLRKSVETELKFKSRPAITHPQLIAYPLSTQDASIVDRLGRRVKLAFVNWSGAHMCRHCVDGLECRKLEDICDEIRANFGFNGVRLNFSLQMYFDNPVVSPKYLTANPQLQGKRAMDIFDIVVNCLTRVGLMVVLNNHVSSSMWCCSTSDGEGLWWTEKYPEYKWIQALRHFAQRYAHNPRVVGIDLRNQIRKTPSHNPTWGDGDILTDWKKAAIEGGNEVLKVNPDLLVFVSGLNFSLDLTPVKRSPIGELIVPNKLVYTGHFYGFSWVVLSWRTWTYQQFKQKMFRDMTFVRAMGVPFWLGEFGSNTADIPWNFLIQYLRETDIDWAYWSLDGFKCQPSDDETYGVYTNNFRDARNPGLLRDLQSIMRSGLNPLQYQNTPYAPVQDQFQDAVQR